ncbi:MAG TPA: tetraacyldisaccharide 4'-kinase [Sphingobacteriaceae bacterium]
MKVLRLILFPFTFIYGFVVIVRNLLFDLGIFKSHTFRIPVISVGNLTVGGAGKSPMTEYLVDLLKDRYDLATLSRGYGRKTRGYRNVTLASTADETGDEPLQFKNKFPSVAVAVAEKRKEGIEMLQKSHKLIILDDAYQHRSVKPGFSILLYEYSAASKVQWFLPTGDLREPLSGRKRADCIVVTKSPPRLTSDEKNRIINAIGPYAHQQVFFSYLDYGDLRSADTDESKPLDSLTSDTAILLLTGIANPEPLVRELRRYTGNLYHHSYADHHTFTPKNILKIAEEYRGLNHQDKVLITTEKDLQRLKGPDMKELLKGLPVYYLPVKAAFNEPEKARFDQLILNYVTKHL